jgi:hypothetical protein
MLEHLAAFAGISCPRSRRLRDFAQDAAPLAHFVVHAPSNGVNSMQARDLIRMLSEDPRLSQIDVALDSPKFANYGATVARVTVRDKITETGFDLSDYWHGRVVKWKEEL